MTSFISRYWPCLALCLTHANAASVQYLMELSGNEVSEWRSPEQAKSLDIDGDRIYGSHGAHSWTGQSFNQQSQGSSNWGWALVNACTIESDLSHDPVDQIDDDRLSEPAGVVLNEFTIELTGIDVL